MRLFELLPQYEEVLWEVDESGELTPELKTRLEEVVVPLEQKCENYAKWFRSLSAEAAATEIEIRWMQRRLRSLESQQEYIKESLSEAMERMGVERGQFGNRKVWFQNNSQPSLVVADESVVPDDFFRVERSVDRESLKDYLAKGNEVAGCSLQRGKHLRIS